MTSLAFVLGLAPLVFATGVASLTRRGVGTAVFGGMIGATALGGSSRHPDSSMSYSSVRVRGDGALCPGVCSSGPREWHFQLSLSSPLAC